MTATPHPDHATSAVDFARAALERHARRTDLAPALWADTCLILERRLTMALEVAARGDA